MTLDDARDYCDLQEARQTHAEILAQNDRWAERRALRVLKGRPEFRTVTQQFDCGQRRVLAPTVAPDPILDLYAARKASRSSAFSAQRYGELRQRVVSPVNLPRDSRWLELPAFLRHAA